MKRITPPIMKPFPDRETAIRDLLWSAVQYDDKPHHLFSCIRRIAATFSEDDDDTVEIQRLMDYAYKNKGKPAPIKKRRKP